MRSVDLRIGFAEVASESFVTPRIEPELARRPGHSSASVVHRVRIRRHPARDEADASWDPRHRRLRWGVARGSRTRGHPGPRSVDRRHVGGRGHARRPRQRPAAVGRLRLPIDGLFAALKRAGAVCWLTNVPDRTGAARS